jgi:GR25 family glycosyltransferase involved in LPS biosynthesis
MGLENEKERMTDVWIQLCLMNAPLNKVREYRAKKDPTLEHVYMGVTKNHIDCLNHMRESKFQQTCLFLEDDFVFTSRFQENQEALLDFFSRDYDYELCFLSASKMHRRLPWDDLLIQSKQICTTSSGYLVHRRYIDRVYQTVVEGYNKLLEHRSQSHLYCIDRYWAKLDKIFVFKNKLGFQKPSLSKITGNMNMMLD